MSYVIEFYRSDERIGEFLWPDNLISAKEHVVDYLPIHQATHGLVIDTSSKQIVFSHPRTDGGFD